MAVVAAVVVAGTRVRLGVACSLREAASRELIGLATEARGRAIDLCNAGIPRERVRRAAIVSGTKTQ